jgi:3-keto-5-aminohexanoate cleavage enzyme
MLSGGNMVLETVSMVNKFPVPKPYWIDIPVGMQRTVQNATPFTPKNLMHLVYQLPTDAMFMTLGVGRDETPAVVQSILLGGHARVGFEDNLYCQGDSGQEQRRVRFQDSSNRGGPG